MDHIVMTFYASDSTVLGRAVHPAPKGACISAPLMFTHYANKLNYPAHLAITYAIYQWEGLNMAFVYDRTPSTKHGWTWVNEFVPEDPEVIAELNLVFDKGDKS